MSKACHTSQGVFYRGHFLPFTQWSYGRGAMITSKKMSLKTLKEKFTFLN